MTLTLTGTNDAPVLTVPASRRDDRGWGGAGPYRQRQLSFTDVDVTDTHTVSASSTNVVWSGDAQRGAEQRARDGFTVDANSWDYSVANAAVQFLGADESVTLSFAVTVSDDSGAANASDTETVTITLHGTNDAPVLSVQASGRGDGGCGEPEPDRQRHAELHRCRRHRHALDGRSALLQRRGVERRRSLDGADASEITALTGRLRGRQQQLGLHAWPTPLVQFLADGETITLPATR